MGVQLPGWVWVGAVSLAAIAGMVNVVGFLGFEHQAVTHLTGTTTLLGASLATGDGRGALQLLGMIGGFVAGATLSGLIIQDSTLRLGRRYGVALTLESLLLAASAPLFEQRQIAGALLAATACGLQNAMATTYSGAVIRSTHVSGMFTDLGIGLGHALRGMPLARRRLALSGLIISGFACGALAGAWMFGHWGYATLFVPAALTGLTGLAYVLYRSASMDRGTPS